MDLGIADNGESSGREEAAQIAIALLADAAKLCFASARVLFRHQPDPGREIAPGSKSLGVGDAGDQSGGERRANARHLIEPPARLVRSMPGHDLTIEFQDLCFQHSQLRAESSHTCARYLGNAPITWIGNDIEQLVDALSPDRRDDPKLGEVSSDRIDHGRLLPDEELPCPVEHQAALLIGRLRFDEPHRRPRHRFANGCRVGNVVLLPFDVRLHIRWRHQAHSMAKRGKPARPMMRGRTSLESDEAWRQLLEERQDVAALQLTADQHSALRIDAVDRLAMSSPIVVTPSMADSSETRPLKSAVSFLSTHVLVEEPSTASQADLVRHRVPAL